jgi:hypothetical protein
VIAPWKSTVSRRLRYQYPLVSPAASTRSPVTVEYHETGACVKRTVPSAWASGSCSRSTNGE